MSKTDQLKGYKRLNPLLKWVFSALSVYFYVRQIQGLEGNLLRDVSLHLSENILLFVAIVLLALVNWNSEAQKFKLLIAGEVKLSNLRAFLTILGGMAISNFTPARTGEYIGRGLLLKKLHPLKVVIATVGGNIAQVLMTYSLGLSCIGIAVLFTDFGGDLADTSKLVYVLISSVVIVLFVLNIKRILPWVLQLLPRKIAKTLNLIKKYDSTLYSKVVLLAFIRYVAFTLQFYLFLQLFSDFAMPMSALLFVPIAYLMQSLVPVPAVSDVGVRVAVSQLLFGAYLMDYAMVQAVTCLWFINLILPGLLGTIYLLISTIRQR